MLPNAGGLVYGTIVVATLLATESARSETYGKTIGAVVLAMMTYWLVITYSHYAGERLEREQAFKYREFARTAVRELSLLYGAALPLLAVLLVWATGGSLTLAVQVAVWVAAVSIVVEELINGIRADLHGRALARQTLVGAVLGLLVIALRLLLH
jgi:L-asparagine transporter-like permease